MNTLNAMKKVLLTGVLALFGLGYGYSIPVETEGSVVLAQNSMRFVEVLKNNINIRTAPKTGSVIQKATTGQTYELIRTANGWHKIRLENGKIGYVSASRNLTSVTNVHRVPSDLTNYYESIATINYGKFGECRVQTFILDRGPYVYVQLSISGLDQSSDDAKYYQDEFYMGTIQHNRIVCTKKKVVKHPNFQMENMSPSDFKAMQPDERLVLDYAPSEYTYYYKGQRMADYDVDMY